MITKDRTGIVMKVTENREIREADTTIYYLDKMVEESQKCNGELIKIYSR